MYYILNYTKLYPSSHGNDLLVTMEQKVSDEITEIEM